MPDKYEFRRYADNLTHPWFNDIKLDFQQLSINRILLCLLCVILMNIDDDAFSTDTNNSHNNINNHTYNSNNNSHINQLPTNAIILYNEKELILSNTKSHKQCNKQKFPFKYLGSKHKNVFHTQLMIGVLFSIIMKCRIPILFSFINIIISSGASFKPKIIPMFIDKNTLKPETFYGSSYKLLNQNMKLQLLCDINNIEDDSSSEDECDDYENENENENEINYDFIQNELPKQLFGE